MLSDGEIKMTRKIALMGMMFVLTTSLLYCSQGDKKAKTDTEESLYNKASQAEIAGEYKQAVDIYKEIDEKYPESEHRDKALFMIGYLDYENLKNKDEALKYFNELLTEYPNSDLVDDAEFMVKAIDSGKDALSTFEEETTE
jgi:outer membrane protein assembly factor BamD (BamD/ComL family)